MAHTFDRFPPLTGALCFGIILVELRAGPAQDHGS
jgi:hypothetical protein